MNFRFSNFKRTKQIWIAIIFLILPIPFILFYLSSVQSIAKYSTCIEACFSAVTINLRSNNTFEFNYSSDLDRSEFNGTYSLSNDTLMLNGTNGDISFVNSKFVVSNDSLLVLLDTTVFGRQMKFFKIPKNNSR